MNTNIVVIGAGSWGTAMAIHLAHCGHAVTLVARHTDHVQSMNELRENAAYLPRITFPENLTITHQIEPSLSMATVVVIMVPSVALAETLQRIQPTLNPKTLVCWGSKGLGQLSGRSVFLHEVARDILGTLQPIAVIGGPSFAKEVASKMPTALVIASEDAAVCEQLTAVLHHQSIRCYSSYDVVGVELCGVVKNILAVAAGVSDGLGLGANTRSALITRGLAEMCSLGRMLKAHQKTLMGLSGVGDIVLSCTSDLSRNRRLGLGLGRGASLQEVLEGIGQVVESLNTVDLLMSLASKHAVSLPITEQVQLILKGVVKPDQALSALLSRPPRAELEAS
ncbi:MAG: glycerol-3-phosphate dehydrogenase [Legionellales bacterium]|nr:glycerol-3-phosphate dehydrogenase [Legionellales bacterium]|tara:strand:- start:149 stop:1162 length:1014 start_codon:yes stop_codon:yes gene_type:complete